MIQLSNAELLRGGKPLFTGATLRIAPQEKVAIIGPNGAGKSSLFQLLLGRLHTDHGELSLPANWHLAHMAQETPGLARTAVDYVLDGLTEWRALQADIAAAEESGDNNRLATLHGRMDDIQGYQVAHEAEIILLGLGFVETDFNRPVKAFSGGWRVRLNLAQTLIQRSDLLLLDEPTNHLDLETVDWLQNRLVAYEGTLLLISHDRDFLDAVVNRVLSFEGDQLITYNGNYTSFERQKAERLAQQQSEFEKQQARRAEMEGFVARFRVQANKAKQAQSRLKALERMTLVAPAHTDSPFTFRFSAGDKVSSPLIALKDAALGYNDNAILSALNLSIYPGMRIGLLGKNGAGKSTFIKHLAGTLKTLAGESTRGAHYYPGYFAQHQVDSLDPEASPLLHLQRQAPTEREQTLRNFLGGFNFQGSMADSSVGPLSGGEKARLALALIAWERPNVLLLDEPTNHLDLAMRSALAEALQAYSGAVIVVSHDRFLMESTVDEFWLVSEGQVAPYPGDLTSYLQALSAPKVTPATDRPQTGADPHDRKREKQRAAEQRRQLAPMKKRAQQAERTLEKAQVVLDGINVQLADPTVYEAARKTDLHTLLQKQADSEKAVAAAEAEWLSAEEALEEAADALNLNA